MRATAIESPNAFATTLCFANVSVIVIKNTRDELPVIEGRNEVNARDQIAFCTFHSFAVEVQAKLDSFVPCTRYHDSNLEIRTASPSCCPQLEIKTFFEYLCDCYLFLDVNECLGDNDCHTFADCTNTNGSYTCKCKQGYQGNGKECTKGKKPKVWSALTTVQATVFPGGGVGVGIWPNAWSPLTTLSIVKPTICPIKLSSSTCLIRFCWHCMFGGEGGCVRDFFFKDMIISKRIASSLSFRLTEI